MVFFIPFLVAGGIALTAYVATWWKKQNVIQTQEQTKQVVAQSQAAEVQAQAQTQQTTTQANLLQSGALSKLDESITAAMTPSKWDDFALIMKKVAPFAVAGIGLFLILRKGGNK